MGGWSNCNVCSEGYKSNEDNTGCDICPAGTYSPSNSAVCYECPKGTFSNRGYSSCTPCPEGYYGDTEGASECKRCPHNTNSYLASTFGNNNDYDSSNLRNTLYKWFNDKFKDNKLVVKEDFDANNYVEYTTANLVNIEGYNVEYVGTLSVREVELIDKDISPGSYLGDGKFLLMNGNGTDDVYVYTNNSVATTNPSISLPVRPVINIKVNSLVGNGTLENPYKIEE